MTETIAGHIYDFPKYYDLVFGSDWRAEIAFLEACFEEHALRPVLRLFEPACGTGRLMIRFAERGYNITGNDLNPKAVDFCNARFRRRGFGPAAVVGDMSAFRLRHKCDAAFNTINSFRHLPSDQAAESHLRCVAQSLAKGGIYVLGLHLTPLRGPRVEAESWSARRGNLSVISRLWSVGLDRRRRAERVAMSFDVFTPTRSFRIVDEMDYRTWTAKQMQNLFARVPELEVAEVYDFSYDIEDPIDIGPETEDVIYVLRRR
ncbi:MAG: class I SAM-dependent methyltransferase [Planctomycetes bacterium]|nr:class I SAM-dependent methyltransferase [Planctomycetota bacterium]